MKKYNYCFICGRIPYEIPAFRFPATEPRRIEWLKAIDADVESFVDRRKSLCRDHFHISQFQTPERKKLNRNAIPTVKDIVNSFYDDRIYMPSSSSQEIDDFCVERNTELRENLLNSLPVKTSLIDDNTNKLRQDTTILEQISLENSPENTILLESIIQSSDNTITEGNTENTILIQQVSPISTENNNTLDDTNKLKDHLIKSNWLKVIPTKSASPMQNSSINKHSLRSDILHNRQLKNPYNISTETIRLKYNYLLEKNNTLTTQLRSLQKTLKYKNRRITILQKSCQDKRLEIRNLKKEDLVSVVKRSLEGHMNDTSLSLLLGQIKAATKNPKGRRWTPQELSLAAALYKRNSKGYKLLRCFTSLPSRSTIIRMLVQISIETGICLKLFKYFEMCINRMTESDKYCFLTFDKMPVKQQFAYDKTNDIINGYEDFSTQRTNFCANHAIVFLAHGLGKKWTQPVGYYLINNTNNRTELDDEELPLEQCINDMITNLLNIGLKVKALVCNMEKKNLDALYKMGFQFSNPEIVIDDTIIHVLFDTPQLLKSMRNLFLKNKIQLQYEINDEPCIGIADIDYVKGAVELDKQCTFRVLQKIKQFHLEPTPLKKDSTTVAAQLLSYTVASSIDNNIASNRLPIDALATAHFIADMDCLFDSFNGSRLKQLNDKYLRTALSENSKHFEFWNSIEKRISTWRFIESNFVIPLTQRGLLSNIKAVKALWNDIKIKIPLLRLRNVNQDCLHNTFAEYCLSYKNPTSLQFITVFRTHMLNCLTNRGILSTTSEKDQAEILIELVTFLQPNETTEISSSSPPPKIDNIGNDFKFDDFDQSIINVYISGYIGKRLLNLSYNECQQCIDDLTTTDCWINNYDYDSDKYPNLVYPSTALVEAVFKSILLIDKFLSLNGFINDISKAIFGEICSKEKFQWVTCDEHKEIIIKKFLKGIANISIDQFCKKKNQEFERICTIRKNPVKRTIKRKVTEDED